MYANNRRFFLATMPPEPLMTRGCHLRTHSGVSLASNQTLEPIRWGSNVVAVTRTEGTTVSGFRKP
jgi:hypothetical protein